MKEKNRKPRKPGPQRRAPARTPSDAQTYFVTCVKGLEEALAAELAGPEIRARGVKTGAAGCYFTGDRATAFRANLWLRSGVRVLEPFAHTEAHGPEELYEWALKLPWHELMTLDQTFSVEGRVRDSELTHSKYAALRIKDALCDAFRDRTGQRPNVDVHHADLPLFLTLFKNRATLYRDMSGTTLHKRGYRRIMHKSSLNEAVAAGLILLSGWDRKSPLCDPMCGSGTFLIEAALMALRRAPGLDRPRFPFESWPDFDAKVWAAARDEAHAAAADRIDGELFGNDSHEGALSLAKKDAEAAGVAEMIAFHKGDIAEYAPPATPGYVFCNPPWGERLDQDDLEHTWQKLGRFLKDRCPNAQAWILSGNAAITQFLRMKASRKMDLHYGKIDTRVLKYEVLPPRAK